MKYSPVSKSAAAKSDLFGRVLLPGLEAAEAFVTEAEEAALIAHIEIAGLKAFKFQQWEGKRLTRSFGWSYDFQTGAFARAAPIPDWLAPLAARAERFADLPPGALAQALLISYGPGAGIGWHKDRPVFEHVVGISLGGEAAMRFRRRRHDKFDRFALRLGPRSIYRLAGEARHAWEHSIAPIETARWSITFRSLAR